MTRPTMTILAVASALAAVPGKDAAGQQAAPAKVEPTEVLVHGGSGTFEVLLSPQFISTLYFDAPVENVLASDQKLFQVSALGNAVAVRPRTDDPNARANLQVVTETMRIAIILRVASRPEDAMPQISFKRAELEQELAERVDAEVRRRLVTERARLEAELERGLAERAFERAEIHRLTVAERSRDHVIVRVTQLVHIGGDALVSFSIQNRSRQPYKLARVAVYPSGSGGGGAAAAKRDDLAGPVVFRGRAARAPVIGAVPPGSEVRLLVVVRGTARADEGRVELVLSEAGGKRAVRVKGVPLQ